MYIFLYQWEIYTRTCISYDICLLICTSAVHYTNVFAIVLYLFDVAFDVTFAPSEEYRSFLLPPSNSFITWSKTRSSQTIILLIKTFLKIFLKQMMAILHLLNDIDATACIIFKFFLTDKCNIAISFVSKLYFCSFYSFSIS